MNVRRDFRIVALLCVALLGLSHDPGLPRVVGSHPPGECTPRQRTSIKALVDTISERELRSNVVALQDSGTRYAPSQGNLRAARYIRDSFLSAGLADASFDEFSYFDEDTGTYQTTRNVIASRRGTKTPEEIVVIGAHFDSITHSAEDGRVSVLDRESSSPGADDNATGVAAVLAAARLLGRRDCDRTLRFIAFSAEEAGIFGSAHAAARSAMSHENVVAMINLDMIGSVKQDPEDIDVLANEQSAWLLDRLTDNAPVYAPGLLVYRIVNARYDGSDHAPFWNNGYPAICMMDDYYPSSRLYHTAKDTVDALDFPFFLKCTRLAVGTLAELAGVRTKTGEPASPPPAREPGGADWHSASGKRLLFTVSAATNEANLIDVSVPYASSNRSLSLGELAPETWGGPRDYPVAAQPRPASRLVYVPMIRLRAPAAGTERGIVKIVDVDSMRVAATFEVGRFPTDGCFNASGTKYYQPYWGERFIDVFDTSSLDRIGRIPTTVPISKLAVDDGEERAVGISTETDSIVFVDLPGRRVDSVVTVVSRPKDVVLTADGLALVCSYDRAAIYVIDPATHAVLATAPTRPRPMRLVASSSRTTVACVYRGGSTITWFHVTPSKGPAILGDSRTMDLGEAIVDAAFGGNGLCYLVSSSKYRVFGLNLASGKVSWAMRTGGPRPRADTGRVVFIGD